MSQPYEMASGQRLFQLCLLAVSTWAVIYSRVALGPLQESIRANLALTDNQIAWLQGPAVAVPMALGAIPMGLLANRLPRVRLFLLFATLNLAAMALAAFAPNLALLFAARCMTGLSLAAVLVAAYAVIGDLYPVAQRGRATMVVALGEIGGAPAAFAVGGVLLAMANASAIDLAGWRLALLWMCAPLVPVAALMFFLREPQRAGVVAKSPPFGEIMPKLWSYRRVILPLLLARIMVWIADGAVLVWSAPMFSRRFGLAPEEIGAMIGAVLLISGLLGPLLGGPLVDLCQRSGGPRRTIMVLGVLAFLSAPTALFTLMPTPSAASVMLAVFLTLGFVINVAGVTLATIVVPAALRAIYMGVSITAGALFCFGVAPLIVSWLSVILGGPTMIGQSLSAVCAITSLLAAVVFILSSRNFDAKAEPIAQPRPACDAA